MPLANLSGDEANEYFVDCMTEELITQLARKWKTPYSILTALFLPYVPEVSLLKDDGEPYGPWHQVLLSRQNELDATLARYVGSDIDSIHRDFMRLLWSVNSKVQPLSKHYYIPSSLFSKITQEMDSPPQHQLPFSETSYD